MNKKIIAITLGTLTAMSSMVFAAPATDLPAGKVAVDLSLTRISLEASSGGESGSTDKKNNFDLGITAGLGNKWSIQYKHQNSNFNALNPVNNFNVEVNAKVQELNAIHQFDKNLQGFVGVNKLSIDSFSLTKWQVGVTGTTKLGDKLSGWATLAGGNDNATYELGIAQELSKDWDVNLFYRHKKFNSLKDNEGDKADLTISGFGLGVTTRF